MKGLFAMLVVLVLGIAGLGFYQGWFQLSANNADHQSNVTLSLDQNKIRADEEKVKDKMRDLRQKVEEKTGGRTDKVPERLP